MLSSAELENLFSTVRNDDTAYRFTNFIEVMEEYQVEGYMEYLDTVMSKLTDATDEEVVQALIVSICDFLENMLLQQGITVVNGLSLKVLTTLVKATNDIAYYEDTDTVLGILGTCQPATDVYADLISLVCGFKPEEVLCYVTSVTENFIPIMQNYVSKADTVEYDMEFVTKVVASYKVWAEKYGGVGTQYAYKFLRQPSTIGLTLEMYCHQYKHEQGSIIARTDNEAYAAVAKDLFGLALISEDGNQNPLVSCKSVIKYLYPDMEASTKLDIELTKLALEYTR